MIIVITSKRARIFLTTIIIIINGGMLPLIFDPLPLFSSVRARVQFHFELERLDAHTLHTRYTHKHTHIHTRTTH